MKRQTLNGYEIADAKAREHIMRLAANENKYVTKESLFEETVILDCGDAFTTMEDEKSRYVWKR